MRHSATCAFLLLLLTLLPTAELWAADSRQQLEALNRKIEALKKNISANQGDRSRAAKRLQRTEEEIGELAAKLHRNRQARDQQQAKLTQLRQRQKALQAQQQQQKALIAEQLRKAYTLNQETPLKMLLNQENPDTLSRNLSYYDYFNRARSEKITQYQSTLQELDQLVPAIEAQSEMLAETERELEQQRQALARQQSKRQADIASIDKELSGQRGSLDKLAKEREALEEVLSNIVRDVANFSIPADNTPFASRRGKMSWPAGGKHLARYGSSRQGSAITWRGVQIAGQEGEKIRAIHNGRVVFADWLRGAGLLIILDHGDNYLSLYGHNQSLLRQEGDWVKAGDNIATLGNSGGQRQAGLYFEIRHKGKPVNPTSWCR